MKKVILLDGERLEYTLERKSVKNINMRVKADGGVFVSAPRGMPSAVIEAALEKNAGFILKARRRALNRAEQARACAEGNAVRIFGEEYPLLARAGEKSAAHLSSGALTLELRVPEDTAARERVSDAFLREILSEEISRCANLVYPRFEAMGVTWPEIKLRRMRSRWGSCNVSKRVLTFNTALVHAPRDCIEYVVTHEFCHFIHPNHSPAFHALMTELMPDWKARKKILNDTPCAEL